MGLPASWMKTLFTGWPLACRGLGRTGPLGVQPWLLPPALGSLMWERTLACPACTPRTPAYRGGGGRQ